MLAINARTASGTSWFSGQNGYVTGIRSQLNPYNLYWHLITTGLYTRNGPYNCIRGYGAGYSPPAWQSIASTLQAAGNVIGMSGPDEANVDYSFPLANGVLGGTGGPSSLTCNSSTTWTVNWTNYPHWGGNGWTFGIFGGTTHSSFNTTAGGTLYTGSDVNGGSIRSLARRVVRIRSSTRPPTLAADRTVHHQWYNSTDYLHYQDFQTMTRLERTTSPYPLMTGPVLGGSLGAGVYAWMGDPNFSGYAEFYPQNSGNALASQPQKYNTITAVQYDPNDTAGIGYEFRYMWASVASFNGARAFLGLTDGSPTAYGYNYFTRTNGISGCAGAICTFSSPHGLYNILANCVTRMTLSGSGNSYFNTNWCIDASPTATTARISRYTPSSSPTCWTKFGTTRFSCTVGSNGADAIITWQNGDTAILTFIDGPGGDGSGNGVDSHFSYTPLTNCSHRGMTFTISSANGLPSYFSSNTFYYVNYQEGGGAGCDPSGDRQVWREVPPNSQTSSTATALVFPTNLSYEAKRHSFTTNM